jgi:multidrug efflux pump subunit AcrA (membrane-fusion protein)
VRDGRVTPRPLRLGPTQGEWVQVLDGLAAGDARLMMV